MSQLKCLIIALGDKRGHSGYKQRVLAMVQRLNDLGYEPLLLWFSRLVGMPNHEPEWRTPCVEIPMPPFRSVHITVCRLSRLLGRLLTRIVIGLFHIDVAVAENATAATIGLGNGVPIVCDFHGDIVEELKLASPSEWRVRLAQEDERLACSETAGWVCASEALAQVLRDRHAVTAPATVVSCDVDVRQFAGYEERRDRARMRLGIGERWVVCYMGGLAKWQEIPQTLHLVRAMRAREPRVCLLLMTQDDSERYMPELSHLGSEGRDYIRMTLTHPEVIEVLPAADLGLLLRGPSPVNYVSSPTKCGEYLASGVPVLTTGHAGDASSIVAETKAGLVLHGEADSPRNVELAVSFLKGTMANRADVAGRSHLAAVRYHNSVQGTANLGDLLREVLRSG